MQSANTPIHSTQRSGRNRLRNHVRPNSCKKLTKRRLFARRPTGRLAESTLDGGTPLALPFYNTAQAACRSLRRCVKPFCNLCDSRWADGRNVFMRHAFVHVALGGSNLPSESTPCRGADMSVTSWV